jgi:hypothetical protein
LIFYTAENCWKICLFIFVFFILSLSLIHIIRTIKKFTNISMRNEQSTLVWKPKEKLNFRMSTRKTFLRVARCSRLRLRLTVTFDKFNTKKQTKNGEMKKNQPFVSQNALHHEWWAKWFTLPCGRMNRARTFSHAKSTKTVCGREPECFLIEFAHKFTSKW